MTTVNVTIHSSQFPGNVRRDLLASLRARRINHKFHYDSLKQTMNWLALHEMHSPSRTDRNCQETYDLAFSGAAARVLSRSIHVIGLGCGGGQKDARLLELLKEHCKTISYAPCDVSVAMTLVARESALKVLPSKNCFPFVCDLATATDLPAVLSVHKPSIITFFGMIPNFEPDDIVPKLASLVRKRDYLLFSANLAPGHDYQAGMKHILPQYDNALTRDWLQTLLLDLGIGRTDGKMYFGIESGAMNLKRVVAEFQFSRSREIRVHGEEFKFRRGETIRLFFSYRYTPELVAKSLSHHGIAIKARWLTESGEEGVFLCRRG